jgi:crotonobetainyl-CoA:carnitine CoA-transferase CaiB-like acyl-CoA transferase
MALPPLYFSSPASLDQKGQGEQAEQREHFALRLSLSPLFLLVPAVPSSHTAAMTLLSGIRVLDLTTPRGELAGRMLADLGAEVLKIEPPGGSPTRTLAPFDERPGSDRRSLYWAALGLGKHSVVLDLEDERGREAVRDLARRADILLESFDPGTTAALGLDYATLGRLNPRLIYVSITPYGQQGPKSRWPATDLTLEAAGGRVSLQGDPDRPPLPVGYPQASFHAAGHAAADAVIALNERELSGLGQHLDTSMQESIVVTLMNGPGYPANVGTDPPGSGEDRASTPPRRGAPFQGVSACADGYVVVTMTAQPKMLAAVTQSVLPALRDEGIAPELVAGTDWDAWERARSDDCLSDTQIAAAGAAISAFFRSRTKLELMRWAWQADVHLGPVNTTKDLRENPHLAERGFWQEVGGITHPGLAVRSSRVAPALGRQAPDVGADQRLAGEWLKLRPPAVRAPAADRQGEAFAGLRVLDLSWVAVGPITAKALADHGATVVHVESSTHVDYLRTLAPFKDGVVGIDRSHYFANQNTSKLGVVLNLQTEGGRLLARRLAGWADVIVENFTPGTMKRLGLGFETLGKERPDLIMVSTCLLGQTGPWASFAGYGPHGAAISGLHGLTGWPDRSPVGPNGPYTDVIAPHYSISALAAAILERRRSGLGQHLDVSQVEAAVHFIEPLVLDHTVNGRTAPASGLDSLYACPHGVYPAAGTERYVAVAVETPEQWRALLSVAPLQAFAAPRFDALDARRAVKGQIDAALGAWTRGFEHGALERLVVEAGVPASTVQRMTDLQTDPQLAARGYFVTLNHGEVGPMPYDGLVTRFSAKREMLHKAAPCLGEDTEYVLREILGLSADEIADYAAAGVFV